VAELICEMAVYARGLLDHAERVEFTSMVAGKDYFGYQADEQSRPINEALWVASDREFEICLRAFRRGFRNTPPDRTTQGIYTIAYAVFAANDVYSVGRKASATFFEILIGHIVSRAIGTEPRKKVKIPESGQYLPTDFVFDPGKRRQKIHLPIKTSTRERGVQAWVHQLVLDRIFGDGVYRGIFVVASETKRAVETGRITEICIPHQFKMFQTRLARLTRIYYLDPPDVYLALASKGEFPRLPVRLFGEAVAELPELV
jgi:hypothetical protein